MDAGNKKVILITGSSSGFGRFTAEMLASDGHTVYASMRASEKKNREVRLELESIGRESGKDIKVVELDVTGDASVNSAIEGVISESGRIDVVVNNAGVQYGGVTEAFTIDQVKTLFEVNFFGVARINRAIIPHMKNQKSGLLIHISSVAGRAVFPFFGLYCASKFAVESLAEAYSYELKDFGIDSVIIEPGAHKTNVFQNSQKPSEIERLKDYGDLAHFAEQMNVKFVEIAQDPGNVAAAIRNLIGMKNGERPLRTVIAEDGAGFDNLNKTIHSFQTGLLSAIGLGHLAGKGE